MGVTVREKPKGSGVWWLFVNHHGKRKAKKVGDRKVAEAAAKQIEAKLVLGDVGILDAKEQAPLLKDYANQWIEGYAKATFKYSTVESYRNELRNHLLPYFGATPIDKIDRSMVKEYVYRAKAKGYANKTVRKQVSYLSSLLAHALDEEVIDSNPAVNLGKLIPKEDPKKHIQPLSKAETHLLLETVKELQPRQYPFFLCAVRTGMRLGELLALEWGSVDFNGRFIEVRQSVSRHRITTPKNKRLRRVDMSKQLTETLHALRNQMRKEALKQGRAVSSWVFCQENGSRYTATTVANRIFHRCLERAGIRHIRFHDLRHTLASQLIQNGESLAYVRDQLGHQSIQTTVDVYGHLMPGQNRSAMDRLDEVDFEGADCNQMQPIRNHARA